MFLRISSYLSCLALFSYIMFIATYGDPEMTGIFWFSLWSTQAIAVLVYEFVWSRI